ncbi:serine/threonine-protein kinase [Nonomuraea sediminis]|uniref:serine/threonine-protein kinase n=1 Tax=Nonomuraea sediminis TaxID=2835864 RepID=UPI001BDD48D2|nr:serine/threonine-protein kinase [Nonomuraea sediminis]
MTAQGTTLAGRYRLDTRIGAGGMGEVWRGEDIVLARTVAIKVLLPGRMDDPGFVARFQAEARAMATINHAGVVDVYDYGISGDTVYLVMKFVDGEPLDRLLARLGRIAPQPAMELIAQAASALQAVHDQGIVHRDVKPGNLLVQRDGTLVLTDFGIARSDLANRLTDAGMVLGTAAYCAPEQAEGAPVTPAVDIYALGVVAYECLVGQRPFDGDSAVTIALKHIREAPPPLPADIPAPVRALVEKALSKDPARRFPTARAMSETAKQIAAGEMPAFEPLTTGATMAPPVEAYQTGAHQTAPEGPPTESRSRVGRRAAARSSRRGGLVAGIAAAVVLGVGAGAVALTGMTSKGTPQPTMSTSDAANSATIPSPIDSPSRTRTRTRPPTTKPPQQRITPTAKPTITKKTPTSSPTPTKSPTKSPSPTPSKTLQKKMVPKVVNLPFLEARQAILDAGFTLRVDNQAGPGVPDRCKIVGQTFPDGGSMLEEGKTVTVVAIRADTCPTPTPTNTVTNTLKP